MDEGQTPGARPTKGKTGGGAPRLGLALEVLRVFGTFAVVFYHASLAYLASPMRLTLWHVYDPRGHVSMDVFAYWVNGFAMPLFFLAAGASAPAAVESRGLPTFLKHRAGRLLRPLLFGFLTILPVTYLLYGYGLLVTGRITLNNIASWRYPAEVDRHLYGLAHLWFLEYLFVVCVVWGFLWRLGQSRPLRRLSTAARAGADRALDSAWSPLWMALPTALIFLADTDTVLRVENIVLPNPSRLFHYLYFFAAGGWLWRSAGAHDRLSRHGRLYLGLAVLTFILMAPLLVRFASAPLSGVDRLAFAGLAAVFPWLTVLGGLGVCQRYFSGKGPVFRYLAEASFWVYVVHLPIVLAGQILLIDVEWPGPVKFALTGLVASGLGLLTYQYAVRYSLVGEWINGTRKRLKTPGRFGTEFGWAVSAALVVLVGIGFVWQLRVFLWQDNLHEVIPGQLYRSARLSTGDFQRLVRETGVKTVVTFSGTNHGWIDRERIVGGPLGATVHVLNLRDDRPPSRETVRSLLTILEQSPRPILLQGYRGLDHCGFAAALARMVGGATPDEALDQFSMRYVQFGGAERSLLGGLVLDYRAWLAGRSLPHTPDRLKAWADLGYDPEAPTAEARRAVAAGARGSVIR